MTDADDAQAQANVSAARTLIGVLAAQGRHVVLSPGARSAPLVLAVDEHEHAVAHVVLDERVAGFVALGLAKATGRAAVLVCTSGSAGGHYLPAVMEAYHAGVPLVVVTADRPGELRHVGAAQATDQTALFGRHTRAARDLPTPRAALSRSAPQEDAIAADWRLQAAQMLAVAEGPAPGPVHLNAPFAEPLLPEPAALVLRPKAEISGAYTALAAAPVQPTEAGYATLVAWARAHPKGAIVCGPMPYEPPSGRRTAAILSLGAALGWPIFADPLSGLRCCGSSSTEATVLRRYDLALSAGLPAPAPSGVLCIGAEPTSKLLQGWLRTVPHARAVLTAPGQVQPLALHAQVSLQADVQQTCTAWVQRLRAAAIAPCGPEHAAALAAWEEAAAHAVGGASPLRAPDAPLDARTLWPAVLGALPPEAGLHVGSSLAVRDLDRFGGQAQLPLRISASRGLNGIDGFIATLVGLALGDDRRWLGVLGDLTFLHDVGALQAARQMQVTATVLVVNNQGGDIFSRLPLARHTGLFERYFRTPQVADIGLLSRACACSHEVVYTGAAVGDAVRAACSRALDGRLHVIEAHMA